MVVERQTLVVVVAVECCVLPAVREKVVEALEDGAV